MMAAASSSADRARGRAEAAPPAPRVGLLLGPLVPAARPRLDSGEKPEKKGKAEVAAARLPSPESRRARLRGAGHCCGQGGSAKCACACSVLGLTRQSRLSQWVTAPAPCGGGGGPCGGRRRPRGGGRGGPHRGCTRAEGNVQPGGAAFRQTDGLTHRLHSSPRKRLRSPLEFIMHIQIYVKIENDMLICPGL